MNNKRLKIVFVLENYYPHVGGVEILFKNVAEGLVKKGHFVTVLTHRLNNSKLEETINGVKIKRVRVPKICSRYFFTFMSIPKLFSLSKNADILHTTTYNAAPSTSFVSKIRKVPSIITIHEVIGKNWTNLLEMSWLSGKFHEIMERIIVKLPFDAYVGVSDSTVNDFQNINRHKKGVVVYNGIDYSFWNLKNYKEEEISELRQQLNMKEKDFVYLFYGRPGPSKGFEYLLKAVQIIKKSIPNSKLIAILSKDEAYKNKYNRIMKYIKTNKLEKDIIILDPVKYKDLPKYLLASNCVCVPSLTEGFGFTTAESCALDLPVVASNTTSIPEVISGKFVLVKPKNPKSIANGIVDVYTKKYKQTKLKKFLWSKTIKDYEKIYCEIIEKRQNKFIKNN
jgi:D-inositol-3-phosphate glycosyltransferase